MSTILLWKPSTFVRNPRGSLQVKFGREQGQKAPGSADQTPPRSADPRQPFTRSPSPLSHLFAYKLEANVAAFHHQHNHQKTRNTQEEEKSSSFERKNWEEEEEVLQEDFQECLI